jgi:hypothetical protein
MRITVRIANVYGKPTVYPVCEKAVLFTALTGKKTLSGADCRIMRELGVKIDWKQNEADRASFMEGIVASIDSRKQA